MNIMQATFNFVINQCDYHKRSINDTFYHIKNSNEPLALFQLSIKQIKDKFNVLHISDLLNNSYSDLDDYESLYNFYCKKNRSKKYLFNEEELSLLFFNNFIDYKHIYGDKYNIVINEYNKVLNDFSLTYSQKKFISLEPLLPENNVVRKILNWSNFSSNNYKYIEDEYNEAFSLYYSNQYKEAIYKSFTALESLIKIKLKEKEIFFNEKDNFSSNIKKLSDNGFFNGFYINEYFISLSSIRNNHGGHGKSVPHVENKEFTYFYLYNIANSLIYISTI